ncbi:hypothetical protein X777_04811 [Ooceraea biroi]|uniref:Transposable element P transposase-like RNase H domain-containing protein n=1 Tax=Ooceraea biroi TaxID=2015173 RepID=A0A026WHB5_OOCBI|nr:hypothetical protein X777_04811 [Ooceraea biroi]
MTRYLSIVDTTCEFDPKFFEIYKVLLQKNSLKRHRILLIDEMSTHESISVNSRTSMYNGLIDFGEGPVLGTTIASLVIKAISLLERIGAKVHGIMNLQETQILWRHFVLMHEKDKTMPGQLRDSLQKLDTWEQKVRDRLLPETSFLTKQTAEGLRITIKSTLDLTQYLLQHCGFSYVLTERINQDALELRDFSAR